MKILWLTWKDIQNPFAGGAELVNHELAKRLVRDGHEVIMITRGFNLHQTPESQPVPAEPELIIDGYKVIRVGNVYTVYWYAYRYFQKHLKGWADLVIDEMNTVPFFAKFYCGTRNIMIAFQLAREIWFHEMGFPFNIIGYLIEPIYLKMLSDREIITESESAKQDLIKFGFKSENINIINIGIDIKPVENLDYEKFPQPTLLSLGSVRTMKRTDHIVKAFELSKKKISDLKLIIAGANGGKFGDKVKDLVAKSLYKDSIQVLGPVTVAEKTTLMRKSHLIAVTSVKEGWGIIVTEANSQGTPAVVYNVDGLRDSVRHDITGLVCKQNNPKCLSTNIEELLLDPSKYELIRKQAWESSFDMTFTRSFQLFKAIVFRNPLIKTNK